MTEKHNWWALRPWSRHSLVLVVAGLYYIAIGVSLHYYVPGGPRWTALVVARSWMPLDAWTAVFIFVGLIALVSARWPQYTEVWGYTILTGLSTLWAGFYTAGVAITTADTENITSAIAWGIIAFLWWAISGLTSPTAPAAVADGSS